jgi:predicted ester cyclase
MEGHLQALRTTFPDFRIQVHEVVAEGDWVACRITAEGTHLDTWQGIQPTGRRIHLRGINLDRVSNSSPIGAAKTTRGRLESPTKNGPLL